MKRFAIFALLCAMLAFSSCADGTSDNTAATDGQTTAPTAEATMEPTQRPKAYLYAEEKSKAGASWTEVESFSYDMDGDAKEEKLRLLTSAKKDSKGRLMIDDTQDWTIEMQDDGEVFTLFNGKVSNGCPYFEVYSDVDVVRNYVRVLVSSSAQFIDKDYEFLSDKRAFAEADAPEAQNLIYSSLPYYE